MSRFRSFLAVGVLTAALAGRSAGGGGNAFVPPGAYTGAATVTLTLPAVVPAGRSIDWASKPNLLSSATRSVSGSLGRHAFGPIALRPSQHGCRAASAGLVCTIALSARAGQNQHLRIATYATTNGTGAVLAAATVSLDLVAGRNDVQPPVYGLAQRIAVRPSSNLVHQGSWQPTQLVIYGIDAAKAPIPSVTVLNQTGSAQVGDVAVTLSGFLNASVNAPDGTPLACCGIAGPIFAYDGLAYGPRNLHRASLRLSAFFDAPDGTAGFERAGDDRGRQHLRRFVDLGFIDFTEEFASNARGNAAPVRAFIPAADGKLAAEDAQAPAKVPPVKPSDRSRFPRTRKPLRSIARGISFAATRCSVYEYPAGCYGKLQPPRGQCPVSKP